MPEGGLRLRLARPTRYLDVEKGDLFMALGRYNGSRGQAAYPNMVLGARKRWEWTDPHATAASSPAK